MKKIGLVGGTSWTSTLDYYRYINEETNVALGRLHSAECILYSVDFEYFRKCNQAGNWQATAALLTEAGLKVQEAGADMLLLCSNTSHIVAEKVKEKLGIPLVDIRTETAKAIIKQGIRKIGLLGTVFTMEMNYYKDVLVSNGLEVIVPVSKADIDYIEDTLLYQLGKGILLEETKHEYLRIINELIARGAEGIILGCTEIPLLISQVDVSKPVFNTTLIHSQAAVELALS